MSPKNSGLLIPVSALDHVQGSETAPITLVEYGDYECPFCGAAYPNLQEVQRELGPQLRFVFRNFPLTQMHPNAELAAEAAESAALMGKFWPMHDALYENQESLSLEFILSLAEPLELDGQRLAQDLEKRRFRARVKEDFMGGVRSGVNGTPGFFINGVQYQGSWEYEALLTALKKVRTQKKAG